jgi:chitinase
MKFGIKTFVFCLSISTFSFAQPTSSFKIVGYYSLDAATTKFNPSVFKKLTHVNLWFLNPDSMGNFTRDLSGLKPFVQAAHKRNVKVLFSIGGGSKQPQYHSLLQDDKRDMLIGKLVDEVLKHNVDGVDVDLEGSNIDENYEKFVCALGTSLRSHGKLMTAAIAIYYKDQFTDAALAAYDFVNVMSYDRTGPWRPEKPGPHATLEHAAEDLEYFGTARNIPKEKMTLGVPFYGYGFDLALASPAVSMNFTKIVSSFKGAERLDEWTMPDGKILYYNGIPTMKKKASLAKEKASGVMIWQVLGDAKGSKSLLKAIRKTIR